MSVFLGIDVGTSGTKTVVIDEAGRVLAEASQSYPCINARPGWSEQDPEHWWTATITTVRAAVEKARLAKGAVKAIGLSGQMHGAVFLDAKDQVVRPAILWNDQRTTEECAQIERLAGGKEGVVRMVANPALTGFTAPKILWLRKHEPHNYARVRKLLLPKDEVRRRMTGEYATDVSDASGMLLLDVERRRWSKPMLDLLEFEETSLGRCYESPEVTGRLTPASAELLGLTPDCLVVAGAGDCPANALGNGIVSKGTLATSIGTSSVMMVHSDNFKVDPKGRLQTVCHAVPGAWMMQGVNLSGGGCLQWFRNQLCRSQMETAAENVYELLDQEAASVPLGSQGLMFLPYLSGERTPHNDADARACFIGLSLAHQRGHMVRAILEGVAYNMKESLQLIGELDIVVNQIRASGGGSRSQLWRQIQADVFEQSVFTINCHQGPAYGVALLAAVGAGAFSSVQEACAQNIKIVQETAATRDGARHYALGFPIFKQLYRSLAPEFKKLSNLESGASGKELQETAVPST